MAIMLPNNEQDPMHIHLTELEYLVSKQHLEQEEKIKEMKEKFETQEK
jgi:hypothetical protein